MEQTETFFDVVALPGQKVIELLAKLSAGVALIYFSILELTDELREYKTLRHQLEE